MTASQVSNDAIAVSVVTFFSSKVSPWLAKVSLAQWRMLLIVLVLIWLVRTLAQFVWVVFPPPPAKSAPVVPIVKQSLAKTTSAQIDLVKLQGVHLFGKHDPAALAKQQQDKKKAESANLEDVKAITRLNLKLQGVIASNDPETSLAIIGEVNRQKLYMVGDKIEGVSGTVKLAKVEGLRVILDNNGKLEALWLYGEDGKKFASGDYTPPARRVSRSPAARSQAPKQVVMDKNEVFKVKSIGDVVRFMIHSENGEMVGYKVRPGRKRQLFEQAGLKTNDIVTSVNGIEVNDPSRIREVYKALQTATEASLEVLRDGSTEFIEIRLSE